MSFHVENKNIDLRKIKFLIDIDDIGYTPFMFSNGFMIKGDSNLIKCKNIEIFIYYKKYKVNFNISVNILDDICWDFGIDKRPFSQENIHSTANKYKELHYFVRNPPEGAAIRRIKGIK